MGAAVTIVVGEEGHLDAHRRDFLVPLETALQWARSRLAACDRRTGELRLDLRAPKPVGMAGLLRLRPWTRGAFWARRRGRTIPSHLVVGRKSATRWLCVWGTWKDESTFLLHTLYPGRAAPREIHDPALTLEEMPRAVRFWSRHALVVAPGEWE